MNTIDDALADLVEEFDLLGDWEERYRYLIELGKALAKDDYRGLLKRTGTNSRRYEDD